MVEESERGEMEFNLTTTQLPPMNPKPGFPGYYALISLMLLILIGCVVAMVIYIRRKARLDELRHRLIPLYSYDPTEEEADWREVGQGDEDQELTEPLYKEAKLAFSSEYGT